MKATLQSMTMALALALALLCGTVLQHHHHDADGTMCLVVGCSDCMCHHDHAVDNCHGHDCPGHDCGDDCGMHLDSFCCEQHHYHSSVPTLELMPCDTFIPELTIAADVQSTVVQYRRPPVRGVIAGYCDLRGLRAPPADNLC